MKRHKKRLQWVLSICATGLVGWWLLERISFSLLVRYWGRLTLSAYVVGLLLTGGFVVLRGIRLHHLMPASRLIGMVGVAAAYSLSCMVAPGGLGELSLPLLLKRFQVRLGDSMGLLMLTRLSDLCGSVMLMAVTFPFIPIDEAVLASIGWIKLPLMVVLLLLILVIGLLLSKRLQSRVLGWLGNSRTNMVKRIAGELSLAFAVLNELPRKNVLMLVTDTVLLKGTMVVFYYFIGLVLAVHVSLAQAAFAMGLMSLLLAFPIQGVAGLGSEDAWWALSLRIVGLAEPVAIVTGITFHLINLLFIAVLGIAPFGKAVVSRLSVGAG